MREFLLELYLKYGEREFVWKWTAKRGLLTYLERDWLAYTGKNPQEFTNTFQIIPKRLEYLKQNDS